MILKVEDLSIKIQRETILKDLTFNIEKGVITGLLGANGAGKTTTFHALIGLLPVSCGKIYFMGEDITHLPMYKRGQKGMGYLSQEPSIFKELTVEENLLLPLEMKRISSKEKKQIVEERLNELHIIHLKKKRADRISGGERRRVEISRSLITNPKILFLDEPFANIDPKTIEDVKGLILFLKNKGISVVITDHNAKELLSFIDRGLFLHDGQLLAQGTKEGLLHHPALIEHYLGKSFSLHI